MLASTLRRRAAHYRELANGATPWHVAQQLEALAEECERDACSLLANDPSGGEAWRPPRAPQPLGERI